MTPAEIYKKLHAAYGQPRWWSDEPYVVIAQSILVQNTSWASVEKVTAALAERLSPGYVLGLQPGELEELIRPCGFCKAKAAAIRRLTEWYGRYGFSAENANSTEQLRLRDELLAIKGVGAETADVILVYAFHRPSFIVDTYTRRLLERLGFHFNSDDDIRRFFELGLERDFRLYGWYHWLILEHGISRCRKTPVCSNCVFADGCSFRASGA